MRYCRFYTTATLEHLQEFAISTWHPSIFGKIRKKELQQLGKKT
jgi:hypothetical protein